MELRLIIIGSSAAIPAHQRSLSGQVLQTPSCSYLIDCGEGTQFGLTDAKIRLNKIDHIFISHLHGDHIFGLFGLLSSASMQGRTREMSVFAPAGLKLLIDAFTETQSMYLNFELNIEEIDTKIYRQIFEDDHFSVYSIPLKHRIPTTGYKFVEKQKSSNIHKEAVEKYQLNVDQIKSLKSGKNVCLEDGNIIHAEDVCFQKSKPRSYAYVSDCVFHPDIVRFIRDVDVLFHEATYMNDEEELAQSRFHSTALQAARIAKMAGAGKLILGHFSSRYSDLQPLLEEARSVFPNAWLGTDQAVFNF